MACDSDYHLVSNLLFRPIRSYIIYYDNLNFYLILVSQCTWRSTWHSPKWSSNFQYRIVDPFKILRTSLRIYIDIIFKQCDVTLIRNVDLLFRRKTCLSCSRRKRFSYGFVLTKRTFNTKMWGILLKFVCSYLSVPV